MKIYLAGVLQFYEGLALEKIGGGTGEYFVKNGNLATRIKYEGILSRREWQKQYNTCPEGGQEQINAYLGVSDANFWRGGNQGIGFTMT